MMKNLYYYQQVNYIIIIFNKTIEIEKQSIKCDKHSKIRITSWCKRLCQITDNLFWKKNRNLHAIFLLNMIINNQFESPYNKFPPQDSLPILSRPLVNSRLTDKFWKTTKYIFEKTLKEDFTNKNYDIKNKNNIKDKNIKSDELTNNKNNINNNEDINKEKNNLNCYNNSNKLNEENEKKIYIEQFKALKLKNEKLDNIILQQEEENKLIIKKIEELKTILKNRNYNII